MTAIYGIFGWPVAHSRSPAMHNAAFAALGRDALYVPFAIPPDTLARAVEAARAQGVAGFNVTLPHKEAVIALLSEVDPAARAIGAVNTVTRIDDRLVGENTDAAGLARSLLEAGVALTGAHVLVLGAGGAARAAVVGLARAGAARLAVHARRPEEAERLCAAVREVTGDAELQTGDLAELARELPHTTLVIQATSATLAGRPEAEAFARALPLEALPKDATVCDLVYKPRQTSVLQRAQGLGLATVDGLGMLLHQGALAFERWTGQPAPLAVMRTVLG